MAEASTAARKRRLRAPEPEAAPDTSDPIEIALKAVAADADGHPLARAVLEKHARLLDVQCQREHEEWSVLRVQRWTRWLILTAVTALLAGIATLLWSASRSTSLVIEPFEVPPQLAQRGLTGKVVSARVLDELARLQRNTESMRGAKSYANDWQDDIKLDIPQTGMSIGEAWRTLKGWLGTQTRMSGEVTQQPGGMLAITTRAGAESGGTASGPEAGFDALIGQAALGLFRVTQPYRHAISRQDPNEAIAALTALTASDLPLERKWAFSGLAARYREIGDFPRSLAMAQRALSLDPDLLPARGNLGHAYLALGRDQEAIDAYRRLDRSAERIGDDAQYDQRITRLNQINAAGYAAVVVRDPDLLRAAEARLDAVGQSLDFSGLIRSNRIEAAVLGHDIAHAARLPRPDEDSVNQRIDAARMAMLLATERGDRTGATRAALALIAAVRLPSSARSNFERVRYVPEAIAALGRVGAADAAAALARNLPTDCYECARARGWAALAGGDRAAARRWFAEGVRLGPNLPAAPVDLGRLEALEGNTAAALALLREAARLAPNWADPMRYQGDVLGRAGRLGEARAAYARAARAAPNWGSLRLNQGRLLAALGDRAGARAAFTAAGRALLAPVDRDRLARADLQQSRNGGAR